MKIFPCFFLCLYAYLKFQVWGRTIPTDAEIEMRLKQLNKPAVKTILSKSGQVVDCVDIYKQPAFDNPLLKNHIIEYKPSFDPLTPNSYLEFENQLLETCPEGTIPIRRISKEELIRRIRYGDIAYDQDASNDLDPMEEYAEAISSTYVSGQHSIFGWAGVSAGINVWRPFVLPLESTSTTIGLRSIFDRDKWIKVGYLISPLTFGDNEPHLFVSIRNGTNHRACINLECPNFVQMDRRILLGQVTKSSTYDGAQAETIVRIHKDNVQQKWWLQVASITIGYFPFSILEGEGVEKNMIAVWGGTVLNRWPLQIHTTTEMGSGHPPQAGFKKAAYITAMYVYTIEQRPLAAPNLQFFSTFPRCYLALPGDRQTAPFPYPFVYMYLGGDGGENCQIMHR